MTLTENKRKLFNIWEGIYDSWLDAEKNACGSGFGGDVYHQRSLTAAKECCHALCEGIPIPQFHKQRSTPLPITVAMMLSNYENIKILDFGGGFGIRYMTLLESVENDMDSIDYTIVEVPEIIESASALHAGKIKYLSALPQSEQYNLVYVASSLQYIEHWVNLLTDLAAYNSEYILLSDVFAGSNPSFVSLQNYYDSKIPHWFINFDELIEVLDSIGYQLKMKSYAGSRRLHFDDTLPMDNFPEQYRVKQTLHLLIQKKSVCKS